jgi:hypothetical protein
MAQMKPNPYRAEWAAWLPGALPLLEVENYQAALGTMPRPTLAELPMLRPPGQLKLAVITSSGAYDRETQPGFVAESLVGDVTHRLFPTSLPAERIAFRHGHYDESGASSDPETVVPRASLQALGVALTDTVISYMGYNLDWPTFIEQTIPQIVATVKTNGATGALLVPV